MYSGAEVVEVDFKVYYEGINEDGIIVSPPKVEYGTVEILMDEDGPSANMRASLKEKLGEWIRERVTDSTFRSKFYGFNYVVRDLCIVSETVTKQCKAMQDICARGFECLVPKDVSKQSSMLRNIDVTLEDIVASGEAYSIALEMEKLIAGETFLEVIVADKVHHLVAGKVHYLLGVKLDVDGCSLCIPTKLGDASLVVQDLPRMVSLAQT